MLSVLRLSDARPAVWSDPPPDQHASTIPRAQKRAAKGSTVSNDNGLFPSSSIKLWNYHLPCEASGGSYNTVAHRGVEQDTDSRETLSQLHRAGL